MRSDHTPVSLHVYRALATLASRAATPWLRRRVDRGKEDPTRWRERLGVPGLPRLEGPLIWLHGISVGESLSLLPLVGRVRVEAPNWSVLITSGTLPSAQLLASRLPVGVAHQFAPLDTPAAVAGFLDHWRPDVGVLVESELWPNLLLGAKSRGVRLALLSAKLSSSSLAGWRRAPGSARALFSAFDLILARDPASAENLAALGARIAGLADLKFGAPPLPVDEDHLARARSALGGRPMILAASTHPGEDEPILDAFTALADPGAALLVIAPRHAERGERIQALARARGLAAGRRTRDPDLGACAVHVADTVGELGLWYRLARLAVVGGSLGDSAIGGHNPLEPARLGCPFIAGPHVGAWPVYADLVAADATRLVPAADLRAWFQTTVEGGSSLSAQAERARAFVAARDREAGAGLDQVLALLT